MSYQVPAKLVGICGYYSGNPETALNVRGVPERVANQDKLLEYHTLQLEELRVYCDFGSSGLWDNKGRMIGYDLISLPFQIVRRLSAWQTVVKMITTGFVLTLVAGALIKLKLFDGGH